MTAALTLLVILAVSLLVVRVGGTALRQTGMPLEAARFQSISALTGTGFTTQEAETMMHHPLRRRILIALMFAGHLGIVSLASTVILSVSSAPEGSIIATILYMLLSVFIICALALSATFDRVMCGFIAKVFERLGWFDKDQHLVIAELPDGMQLAEHTVLKACNIEISALEVTVLQQNKSVPNTDTVQLLAGDDILCFGSADAHARLGALLS